jgi:hypothetical protein
MATVDKNFKVKNGLVVEGTTATVAGSDVITEDIITSGTQTNITVTYDAVNKQVNFVAENGVADSTTDDLEEGTTNLYYTNTRVKNIIDAAITNGTQTNITVTYDDATNALSFTSENGVSDSDTDDLEEGSVNLYFTDQRAINAVINGAVDTDDIEEGSTNLYFTDERAQDAVGEMFSGNTENGISVTYDDSTNKVNFNVNDPVITISGDVGGSQTMTNLGNTTIEVTLDTVNSNVGSFGGQTKIPTFTVNGKGLLTAAGEVDVATNLSIAADTGTDTVSLLTDTLTFEGGTGITSAISDNKITVDIDSTVVTLEGVQTLTNKTMGDDLLMDGFQISGLGTPDQADHAATKAYVDAVSEGLHIHESVRAATDGNISIANGLENGDTVGGVTLATGNRILVKDQTTTSENGIYVVQVSGQALRATDFDTASEVDSGDFVFVTSGTYANTGWVQILKPATIGTDPLSFTQFSGAGTFLAGNGLILEGNVFEIDETITATRTFATDEAADALADANDYTDTAISTEVTDRNNAITDAVDAITTSVIEEGTNLYFTDQRAVDALESVVPQFTAVEVGSVSKQVAATVGGFGTLPSTAYTWAAEDYRTASSL